MGGGCGSAKIWASELVVQVCLERLEILDESNQAKVRRSRLAHSTELRRR